MTWLLYGLIEGTVGSETGIVQLGDGNSQTLSEFLHTQFLYNHNMLGFCVLILFGECCCCCCCHVSACFCAQAWSQRGTAVVADAAAACSAHS